jgi:hypothetical protein
MQLITISSFDDLEIELNSIDLEEDFDILFPFMSKNYMNNDEYDDLLEFMNNFANENDFSFEIERDTQDRSFVYHFLKEEL